MATGAPAKATALILEGKVVTQDPARPAAQAVGVRDGRIVAVGTREEVEAALPRARRLDLPSSAVILPGLSDAHLHVEAIGFAAMELDVSGLPSKRETLARIAEHAGRLEPGVPLHGRGWDQNSWADGTYPTHEDLDSVVGNRPALLWRVDGHAAWVSRAALKKARITRRTADPKGGRILRDETGEPTGILIDTATSLVAGALPQRTRADRKAAIVAGLEACAAVGLTAVHDAGIDRVALSIYEELGRAGRLPIRVYAMLDVSDPEVEAVLARGPRIDRFGGRLTVRTVKLFADGALGSRGAALLKPYADDPANRGLLLEPQSRLTRQMRQATRAGFQVAVHAIGDRANRVALESIEKGLGKKAPALRPRIEHAQIVAPADIPRFARLGVIASMQPTHATSDMPWVSKRLGHRRLAGAYAWRSMLNLGVPLAFGSDAPVETVDPRRGLFAAVTRTDTHDKPQGGWLSGERVSPEQALRAFTLGAAYAAFSEKDLGSIEVGKRADFTILDRDPTDRTLSANEAMLKARVLATIVGGEVVAPR